MNASLGIDYKVSHETNQSFPLHPLVQPPAALTTLLFFQQRALTQMGVLNVAFHS